MVTQLQPDVRAYLHGAEVIKRYIRAVSYTHLDVYKRQVSAPFGYVVNDKYVNISVDTDTAFETDTKRSRNCGVPTLPNLETSETINRQAGAEFTEVCFPPISGR